MTIGLLILALVLTLGTALFVAAEFSLVALDRPAVQRAVDAGDTRARPVLGSLRRLSTLLSACQIGITVTTLALGFIANPAIGALISPLLQAVGMPETAANRSASGAALIIATVFSMILGEMVPKTLAVSAPLGTAKVVAVPMAVVGVIFKPAIAVLNGSANWVLHRMGIEPQEELSAARSPSELASLVRTSVEAGTLDSGTGRLVARSLGFGDQTAADVMTPRNRASAIDRTATADDLVTLARRTGHSRFPVTAGDDWDDIDGVVHVKKAIAVPHERREGVPVSALMSEAVVVPETLRLDPLLIQLRDSGLQMGVVVDEYGGTAGLVTLEDLVEEIVGEVHDEHDRAQTTGRLLGEGVWTVPGLWRPDEVRDRITAPVPEGSAYETVGGWVMAEIGRVPEVGDTVTLDGWQVSVVDMDGHRVDRLRFVQQAPTTDDGGAAGRDAGPSTGGESA